MSETHAATDPRLGRPRSVKAHNAVLTATAQLLAEGGYPAATVDAISQRSGVSKATIYKHWPSRTAVAAEAFGGQMATAVRTPHTDDPRADLVEQVHRVSSFYASMTGRVFAQLLAACVTDPDGAQYFREYFLAARRAEIATLWNRATEAGIARPQVDVETATDILFGPLVFRLLTGHAELSEDNAKAIAEAALDGLTNKSGFDGNATEPAVV
jgi:AcrR family transcriptional regulator